MQGALLFLFISLFILLCVGVFSLLVSVVSDVSSDEYPYKAKRYFFSRSEREFFRILNQMLDHRRYAVFPKVRLADFVEVSTKGQKYQGWFNRIKSKHVDFLLWDLEREAVAMVIELDGNSHNSSKTRDRDVFVEQVYKTVGIRLERVRVGSDFRSEIERILNTLKPATA